MKENDKILLAEEIGVLAIKRKEKGMTQTEIAKICDCSRSEICKFEKGQRFSLPLFIKYKNIIGG